jgi:hypothetical protein
VRGVLEEDTGVRKSTRYVCWSDALLGSSSRHLVQLAPTAVGSVFGNQFLIISIRSLAVCRPIHQTLVKQHCMGHGKHKSVQGG